MTLKIAYNVFLPTRYKRIAHTSMFHTDLYTSYCIRITYQIRTGRLPRRPSTSRATHSYLPGALTCYAYIFGMCCMYNLVLCTYYIVHTYWTPSSTTLKIACKAFLLV